jgi:hypothetical protein
MIGIGISAREVVLIRIKMYLIVSDLRDKIKRRAANGESANRRIAESPNR